MIGPVGQLQQALDLIEETELDAAVLDVNLDGIMSYPLAAEVERRRGPFVFATGYGQWALPETRRRPSNVTKPFSRTGVGPSLSSLLLADQDIAS